MGCETDSSLEVRCGYFALGYSIAVGLKSIWREKTPILIVDAPFGFALTELPKVERERTVVISDNPCPEYWADLWQLKPRALLVKGTLLGEIQSALEQAVRGESFKRTPNTASALNERERSVLRLCAMGGENQEIARKLGVKQRTVANHIYRIKDLLNLRNRNEFTLYYLGHWDCLDSYRHRADAYVSPSCV